MGLYAGHKKKNNPESCYVCICLFDLRQNQAKPSTFAQTCNHVLLHLLKCFATKAAVKQHVKFLYHPLSQRFLPTTESLTMSQLLTEGCSNVGVGEGRYQEWSCLLPALQRTTVDDLGLGFLLLQQIHRGVGCVPAMGVGVILLTDTACPLTKHQVPARAKLDRNVGIIVFLIMFFPLACWDLLAGWDLLKRSYPPKSPEGVGDA